MVARLKAITPMQWVSLFTPVLTFCIGLTFTYATERSETRAAIAAVVERVHNLEAAQVNQNADHELLIKIGERMGIERPYKPHTKMANE